MHYLARSSLSELNTLWEWGDLSISESNLRPPLIWYVESHESDQSTRKTEGSLTPRAHANWSCVSDHASVVSERYNTIAINHNPLHWSCKTPQYNLWCPRCGKCGRNRGMQSYNGIYYNAECHGICRSLDELIKSRSVNLNRLALWTSIYKY